MKTLPRSGSSVLLAALLASGCGGELIGPSDAGSVTPMDCSFIGCGDTFVVRVSHPPSGTVLAEAAESVRYTTSTPNGPTCGPVCHHATLTPITRALPGPDGGAGPGYERRPCGPTRSSWA